jgi:hypothetical protein
VLRQLVIEDSDLMLREYAEQGPSTRESGSSQAV